MNVKVMDGNIAVDDRGSVSFVNDFDFADVKRFYVVENHSRNFVRAWHAHKLERKYVYVSSGSIILGAVEIDDFENPSKNLEVTRIVLSALKPRVIAIPSGFANGFKTLEENTKVFFFSSSTLQDSVCDDYRYPHDFWDVWKVDQR